MVQRAVGGGPPVLTRICDAAVFQGPLFDRGQSAARGAEGRRCNCHCFSPFARGVSFDSLPDRVCRGQATRGLAGGYDFAIYPSRTSAEECAQRHRFSLGGLLLLAMAGAQVCSSSARNVSAWVNSRRQQRGEGLARAPGRGKDPQALWRTSHEKGLCPELSGVCRLFPKRDVRKSLRLQISNTPPVSCFGEEAFTDSLHDFPYCLCRGYPWSPGGISPWLLALSLGTLEGRGSGASREAPKAEGRMAAGLP